MTRDIICFIPLIILLPGKFGIEGILYAAPAADLVLRQYDNIVRIFIYAPEEYLIKRIMDVYGDTHEEAIKYIHHSDEARAAYYHSISNAQWGDIH